MDLKQGISYWERERGSGGGGRDTEIEGIEREIDGRNWKIEGRDREIDGRNWKIEGRDIETEKKIGRADNKNPKRSWVAQLVNYKGAKETAKFNIDQSSRHSFRVFSVKIGNQLLTRPPALNSKLFIASEQNYRNRNESGTGIQWFIQAIAKCLKKVIESQVPLLHQNVTEYWVNLSFKKVINYKCIYSCFFKSNSITS